MRLELESKKIVIPMLPSDRKSRYPFFNVASCKSLFCEDIKEIYIKNWRISALVVEGVRPDPDGNIRQAIGWGK